MDCAAGVAADVAAVQQSTTSASLSPSSCWSLFIMRLLHKAVARGAGGGGGGVCPTCLMPHATCRACETTEADLADRPLRAPPSERTSELPTLTSFASIICHAHLLERLKCATKKNRKKLLPRPFVAVAPAVFWRFAALPIGSTAQRSAALQHFLLPHFPPCNFRQFSVLSRGHT